MKKLQQLWKAFWQWGGGLPIVLAALATCVVLLGSCSDSKEQRVAPPPHGYKYQTVKEGDEEPPGWVHGEYGWVKWYSDPPGWCLNHDGWSPTACDALKQRRYRVGEVGYVTVDLTGVPASEDDFVACLHGAFDAAADGEDPSAGMKTSERGLTTPIAPITPGGPMPPTH